MSETIIRDTDIPHDDNVPEQTRHIVIPSYAAWFDYNRYFQKIQQNSVTRIRKISPVLTLPNYL